jgi:hypothetical protein
VEKAGLYRQNRNWQIINEPILSTSKLGVKNKGFCPFYMLMRNNFFIDIKNFELWLVISP